MKRIKFANPPDRATAYLHYGGAFCGTPTGPFLTKETRIVGGSVLEGGTYKAILEAEDGTLYVTDRDRKTPIATVQIMEVAQ